LNTVAVVFEILILVAFTVYIIRHGEIKRPVKRADIDMCIEKLIAFKHAPLNTYIPNELLMQRLKEDSYDVETLNLLCRDILSHCGMHDHNIRVDVVPQEDRHVAGLYSYKPDISIIRIVRKPYDMYQETLATLVHESMHHLLISSRIIFEDRFINEALTDTATIFMGFDEVMQAGYAMQGYLTTKDLQYVRKRLKDLKNRT